MMLKTVFRFHWTGIILLISCQQAHQNKENHHSIAPEKKMSTTIVDLSHEYDQETVYWVTAQEFDLDTVFRGQTEQGYYYAANNFSSAEHGGTHIDAPVHFAENGQTVDQIPLEKLIGKGIKIDVSENAVNNKDYLISVEDLQKWEAEHDMPIPNGSIVLLQTGHSRFYPDKKNYLGTDQRGKEAIKSLHFPGLSEAASIWLITERNIHAIGIDTPSIDYGQSTAFRSHVILLSKGIPAFENLCNLEQLPDIGFEIIALPMKIKGGSGAPLRIIATMRNP